MRDDIDYAVVANDEDQFSIWPSWRPLPPGWRTAGPSGPKHECLEFIERMWTDMRPRSLQQSQPQQGVPARD